MPVVPSLSSLSSILRHREKRRERKSSMFGYFIIFTNNSRISGTLPIEDRNGLWESARNGLFLNNFLFPFTIWHLLSLSWVLHYLSFISGLSLYGGALISRMKGKKGKGKRKRVNLHKMPVLEFHNLHSQRLPFCSWWFWEPRDGNLL